MEKARRLTTPTGELGPAAGMPRYPRQPGGLPPAGQQERDGQLGTSKKRGKA